MKGAIVSVLFMLVFASLVGAQTIEIEKTEITPIIIADIGNPLEYTLEITNNGATDTFEISSTAGFRIEPNRTFEIQSGDTLPIRIKAYASQHRLDTNRGEFVFEYQIMSTTDEDNVLKDKLRVEILELDKILSVTIDNLNPESTEAIILIENTKKIDLENITFEIEAPFFEGTGVTDIAPFGKSNLSISVDDEEREKLVAGDYNAEITLRYKESRANYEVPFNYLEKEGVLSDQDSKGFIIRTTTIEKSNIGNTPVSVSASERVDILSRIFTTFTVRPDSIEKEGFFIKYNWDRELNPGDDLIIEIKTNYTLPFIVLILVIGAIVLVKIYLETNLKLRKNVTLVRTKGEELAFRIRITAKARKNITNVKILDRIPSVTKLYNQFGIKPDHIDSKTRTLGWNIKHLNAGEERVFSYIVYSKIKIVGRFELPMARATYEHDNKRQEVYSNKTSFVAETAEMNKI